MVTHTRDELFHALADPTRWRIVQRLSSGSLPVSEIAAEFPMSRPAVSKHLRVLRMAGLVVEQKVGRQRIYELVTGPLEDMAAGLGRLALGAGARRGTRVAERPSRTAVRRGARRDGRDAEARAGRAREREGAAAVPEPWRSW